MKTRYETKRKSSVMDFNQRIKEFDAIKILYEKNKLSKALSEIEKYMEKYPDDYFGKFLAGNIYFALDDNKKAEEMFIEVSESNSNNKNSALVQLAKLNESQCNIPYAKYYYEKAIEQSEYIEKYSIISLARIERQLENYKRAEEVLQLLKSENEYLYSLELSKIRRDQNNIIDASILLSTIPKTEDIDFNREVSLERAKIEMDFSCYENAKEYLNEVKDTKKKDILYMKAIYEEAVIAYEQKDYIKAERLLKELIKNKVYLGEKVTFLLGKACEKQSKIRVAKRKYNKGTTSSLKSIRAESALNLANICIEEANYEEAKGLLQLVLIEKPEYTKKVYYMLLAITIRNKDYQQGKTLLKLISNLDDQNKEEADYKLAETIINSKLNENITDNSSYINRQISNYNPLIALEKIKLQETSINLEDLFYTLSDYLVPENQINKELMDVYEIDLNVLGYNKTPKATKIKVTVIPNTKNIVMIEETNTKSLKDAIKYDMKTRKDVLEEEKILLKQKSKNQLEKFLKKYNIQNN